MLVIMPKRTRRRPAEPDDVQNARRVVLESIAVLIADGGDRRSKQRIVRRGSARLRAEYRARRAGQEIDRAGKDRDGGIRIDIVKGRRYQQIAASVAIEIGDRSESKAE